MKTKLNKYEDALFRLLRFGLWNEPLSADSIDGCAEAVMSLARKQSVTGIVAKAILQDKELSAYIPNSLRLKLKSLVVSNVMTYEKMTGNIEMLVSELESAGVRSILLKGHSLAANYPHPELRQCGDIDLYVGEDQALKAYDILAKVCDRIQPRISAESGKHFSAWCGEIEVEVHRHTSTYAAGKYARIYDKAATEGLESAPDTLQIGTVTVNTPSALFNAYYIFDHLFEHFLNSGIGLRHLCDWMLFLHRHKEQIDLDRLKALLCDMKLLEPWQAFGCILVSHLGMPEEDFPFYAESSKADKVLEYILSDGNFGKETAYYQRRTSNYLLTKANALWCHIVRMVRLFSLFPGQSVRHFCYVVSNYFVHLREDIRIRIHHGR